MSISRRVRQPHRQQISGSGVDSRRVVVTASLVLGRDESRPRGHDFWPKSADEGAKSLRISLAKRAGGIRGKLGGMVKYQLPACRRSGKKCRFRRLRQPMIPQDCVPRWQHMPKGSQPSCGSVRLAMRGRAGKRGKGCPMLRNSFALLILAVGHQHAGPRDLAAPDDYTGPTPADGLGFNDRAGSILGRPSPRTPSSIRKSRKRRLALRSPKDRPPKWFLPSRLPRSTTCRNRAAAREPMALVGPLRRVDVECACPPVRATTCFDLARRPLFSTPVAFLGAPKSRSSPRTSGELFASSGP